MLIVFLLVAWISLSGYFSILPLVPGLVSLVVIFYLFTRAKNKSLYNNVFSLQTTGFIAYLPYIAKEIFNSNIDIVKTIFKSKQSPVLISIENEFNTKSSAVLFANSVTLTPGSIVVHMDDGDILIHCISQNTADSVLDKSMLKKVKKLEKVI